MFWDFCLYKKWSLSHCYSLYRNPGFPLCCYLGVWYIPALRLFLLVAVALPATQEASKSKSANLKLYTRHTQKADLEGLGFLQQVGGRIIDRCSDLQWFTSDMSGLLDQRIESVNFGVRLTVSQVTQQVLIFLICGMAAATWQPPIPNRRLVRLGVGSL